MRKGSGESFGASNRLEGPSHDYNFSDAYEEEYLEPPELPDGWEKYDHTDGILGPDSRKKIEAMVENEALARVWFTKAAQWPDIFRMDRENEEISEELAQLYECVIEALEPDRVLDIIELRARGDFKAADEMQVDYLSELFGLEKKPTIGYTLEDDTYVDGYYSRENNLLILNRRWSDVENDIYDARDDEFEISDTIAHELWHAYQYQEAQNDTYQGNRYAINFEYYQGVKDETGIFVNDQIARYEQQLIEREAKVVGQAYKDYFTELCNYYFEGRE